MTLQIEAALSLHPLFRQRVHMGFLRVAQEVAVEPPSVPGNPVRVGLARAVHQPDLASPGYAAVVAAHPAVAAAARAAHDPAVPDAANTAVSDAVLLDAVRALWNQLCGFHPAPAGFTGE
ncbi:hypothetical protein ACIQXD_29595 [Streptomyces uncialis]|uniref:hypothetical protein n=1 Tax=Streptomyces uncialis TaxID=1048205 RepID=UPI0038192E47